MTSSEIIYLFININSTKLKTTITTTTTTLIIIMIVAVVVVDVLSLLPVLVAEEARCSRSTSLQVLQVYVKLCSSSPASRDVNVMLALKA